MIVGLIVLFRIPISVFASCVGYCQYQIVNRFHLGLDPGVTKAQRIGAKVHKALEEADLLVEREEVSEDDLLDKNFDLDFPRESVRVLIDRFNKERFLYSGRIDKVVRKSGDIFVIDDKTTEKTREMFPDRLAQLSCYCEGFASRFSETIAFDRIFFAVVQRDRKGEVLAEEQREYDSSMRDELEKSFHVFESVLNKTAEPCHHNNPNKCRACSFDCMWRIGEMSDSL